MQTNKTPGFLAVQTYGTQAHKRTDFIRTPAHCSTVRSHAGCDSIRYSALRYSSVMVTVRLKDRASGVVLS